MPEASLWRLNSVSLLLSVACILAFANCSRRSASSAPAAKLLYYSEPQNEYEVREGDEYRFPRREGIELTTGAATAAAIAVLRDSKPNAEGLYSLGMWDLGYIVFQNEHGDAEFVIETTDAPHARLRSVHSDADTHWMPQIQNERELQQLDAPAFYRLVLPEIRRVDPQKVALSERVLKESFEQWLQRK